MAMRFLLHSDLFELIIPGSGSNTRALKMELLEWLRDTGESNITVSMIYDGITIGQHMDPEVVSDDFQSDIVNYVINIPNENTALLFKLAWL